LKASTWKEYRTTYNLLKEYFGNKNPTFDEINLDFYTKFNIWIRDKEISVSTLSSHWKRIKTVMGEAHDRGLHNNTYYRKFKRVQEVSDSIALTELEVEKIEWAVLPARLDVVRDYFVAACYCGVRYSDYSKIRSSNVKNRFLTYRSQKTDILCHIPVHWKLRLILEKYKGVLPELISNQKFDKYIKEVCEIAGIDELQQTRITKGGVKRVTTKKRSQLVTSHTARRTFATRLVLKGVPVHLIMLMTGHKSLDSFDKYVRLRELQSKSELAKIALFADPTPHIRMPKEGSPIDDWY
jgi:integrase